MNDFSEIPYFMTNEEWYVTPEDDLFFEDGRGYHLSDNAPQEAIDSYNEFYSDKPLILEDGETIGNLR